MTKVRLICHPATPAPERVSLEADVDLTRERTLVLRFHCRAPDGMLRIPARAAMRRGAQLWRHTCCELFAAPAAGGDYREYNWSPSGAWAAYAFADYREPDPAVAEQGLVLEQSVFAGDGAAWTLEARIAAAALPRAGRCALDLGLAVILESKDARLSYWALAHTGARPDFHQRASFVLRLE